MKYIEADEAIKVINKCKNPIIGNISISDILDYNDGIQSAVNELQAMTYANVIEVESLKTYIMNLMSDIPLTDYIKDDYDMGFLDALRIIYTHICGADMRGETNEL